MRRELLSDVRNSLTQLTETASKPGWLPSKCRQRWPAGSISNSRRWFQVPKPTECRTVGHRQALRREELFETATRMARAPSAGRQSLVVGFAGARESSRGAA